MLIHLRRIMSRGNLNSVKIDQIETLEMELRFLTTFLKYHHVLLPDSSIKITKKAQLVAEMLQSVLGGIPNEYQTELNIEGLVSQLQELTEGNTSLRYNYEFSDSYLLEYMDCLNKNLNDVPMCVDRSYISFKNEKGILQKNRFSKQVKILQKKMRFLRYLYATEIRGYIDYGKLECLEILIQFMANNVALFCFAVWVNDGDDRASDDYIGPAEDEDETDDILSRPSYLFCLIALVELEMKKIFHGELKASKFTQSRTFKDKKLPKEFSKHLYNLLMYLRNKKTENFCNNVYARNIDVEIEFLLIFLSDVPNRFINGKRLNEILEKAGVIVGDVLCVIQKIIPSSIIKDDSSTINLFTVQILEKTENMKAQVERYYRSFKFIPSQFPTVGGLSFLVSLLRKMNEMLKLESGLNSMIKPHIVILKRELSYLNSTFRDVEKVHHDILWIAEGFVQDVESGRLEEAAEGYLMDLISSNVIMVSKRGRYNGKVKYCQVHDIVLHFCLERSREEKFMLAVKGNYSNFRLSDWKESRVSFSFSDELSEIASKTRKPFHQHLRSLRMTLIKGEVSNWNSFRQFSKLRLLKVLNLSSHTVGRLSSAALQPLIHLKYLAVSARKFDFHPESHLPHIETLIVLCPFSRTVLPPIFWKMKTLRHVEINDAVFDLKNNKKWIAEESSKLENLRILKQVAIKIGADDNVDVLLRRCPNLQELEIGILCDEDSVEICQLESLTQLQILRLSIDSFQLNVSKLHLPLHIKKLVLRGTRIESIVSSIGGLPSIEYLKLVLPTFIQSKEWCLGDVTFHKLKLLKLEYLNISRWDASEESFPLIERLVIKKCHELEEIPLSFADIQTLKQIKLVQCNNKSLKASALKIKEEAEAIGGSDIIDLIVKVSRNKLLCENHLRYIAIGI